MTTAVATALSRSALPAATALASLTVGYAAVEQPEQIRLLVAALVGGALLAVAATWPRQAIVAVLLALPFLALTRRLLIPFSGWDKTDPLLLVAPAVAATLMVRLFVLEGRPLARDRISQCVLALLGLAVIQIVNPNSGSVTSGVVGLLFVGAPLLWFFIGRELADRRLIITVCSSLLAVATIVALYGIAQTRFGFTSWDQDWITAGGYESLRVSTAIRPFSTFSSSAEYAVYVTLGIVVAVVFALTRRPILLLPVPLLAAACFLQASRSLVVTGVATLLLVAGLRTGRVRVGFALVAAALAVGVFVAERVEAPTDSTNPFVRHQLGGLADPLDENRSTLQLHWNGLIGGFQAAYKNPLGEGTGSATLAGGRFGGTARGTELDITDAFVSFGVVGGVLYLIVFVGILSRALRRAARQRTTASLAVAGILVLTAGQWRNGAYYAVSSVVWLLAGWTVAEKDGDA